MKKPYLPALLSALIVIAPTARAADVVIGVPNWPSVKTTAHILKHIIEENLGLEVELQNGTNPVVFEAMDKGAMHAHPEVWMPNQQNLHDTFVKDKKTVVMNPNGVPSDQWMCVTKKESDAHGITSVEDLTNPDNSAVFDSTGDGRGELWIGAAGWASTNIERIRAKSYGYDQTFELTEKDEGIAYAELTEAIKSGKPWAGFCYAPHWVFAVHGKDIVVLNEPPHDPAKWNVIQPTDDPQWLEKSSAPVAWDTAYLHVHYAKSLEESQPEVAKLFYNIKLTPDDVAEMLLKVVVEEQSSDDFAKEWTAKNEDRVISWLGN